MKLFKWIIFLSFCTLTCSKNKSEKPIEIKLLNEELHFAAIFASPSGKKLSEIDTIESVYNRYANRKDWVRSINTIRFEITNNTTEKLFLINNDYIYFYRSINNAITNSNITPSDIYIEITDGLNRKLPYYSSFHESSIFRKRDWLEWRKQKKKDSIKGLNSIYNNYWDEYGLSDFKILEPNESIEINTKLSLPIPMDYDNIYKNSINSVQGLPMYKDNVYNITFNYVVTKQDIEKRLNKRILDSLKQANVTIKDVYLSTKTIKIFPN